MSESSRPSQLRTRDYRVVPYACAAATGIRTSVEMPQIIADLRERAAR
jgi:hypothetical protein